MTKKEMFNEIKVMLANNEDVVAFCDHEIELLNKKSANGSKPTKNQIENENYKIVIQKILREAGIPMTISEMMEDDRLKGLKNQRVSALVTQLKNAEVVIRTVDKKKAYFELAE